MTDRPKPTLSSILVRYATGRIYNHILGAVVTFLRPKLLAPDLYGIWTLLRVIPPYSAYAHLGSRTAMRYLIPQYRSQGEADRAAAVMNTVFSGGAVLNLLVAISLVLVAFLWEGSPEFRIGLGCMAAIVVLQFLQEFIISVSRAHEDFALVTRLYYLESTATFLLTLPLLYWLGIYGLYLTVIGAHLAVLGYLTRCRAWTMRWKFDWGLFRELVGQGFPALLTNLAILLITTADRFVVGSLLGAEDLGYYGIAVLQVGFLTNIPGAAREVLEPMMMRDLETKPAETVVNEYLLKPFMNTAYLMPFVIGPVFLLLPVLLPLVLPRYAPGVVPSQILLSGIYFLTLSYVTHTVIFARKWQWTAVGILALVLGADVAAGVLFVSWGFGLAGVALASSLAYFLLFLGLFLLVAMRLGERGGQWNRHVLAICLPFPYLCGWIALLRGVLPRLIPDGWPAALVGVGILLIALFVFHRWASRTYVLLKPFAVASAGSR